MILFKPDDGEGYREIELPITPQHAIITGYNPATVVELLAHLWAYPNKANDALKLLEGKPAEIVSCRYEAVEIVGLRWDYCAEQCGRSANRVRFLHGCDIMCYAPGNNRKLLIEMLQRDRCFVSMDPISLTQSVACMSSDDYEGLFVVYQWHVRPFPEWSEDAWKSFGCQARPHIQFQFP